MSRIVSVRSSWLVLALGLSLAACGEGEPPPVEGDGGPTECEPDHEVYATQIAPMLDLYCGQCHGETPNFGAPVALVDEAFLYQHREPLERWVDRIGDRVAAGTMPPPGMPRLPAADAELIAQWATCGARHADPQSGLTSSRTPFLAPTEAPTGLATLEFLADEHSVAVDDTDAYQCFVFDADITAERFVRRFEMVMDETRVLHHLILLRDVERHSELGSFSCIEGGGMPVGSEYLYAWAPGQGALEFPEGGLRIAPGERFLMQIHYNNGARIPDVRDSSGVRLFLDEPTGPEYGMIAIGPLAFGIPARNSATVSSRCTFPAETRLIAGMPHMHQHGRSFSEDIIRVGGAREPLIRLTGWQFESQLFYDYPITLAAGDAITTSCTFQNDTSDLVTSGVRTQDEMCFDFMYATPPPTSRYCDEGDARTPTDVRYIPGACVPDGTPTDDLPLVRGGWVESTSPPALTQGPVPDGRWIMESLEFTVSTAVTPIGRVDLERTYVIARGQIFTEGGRLVFDIDSDNVVQSVEGPSFGGPNSIGFGGPFAATTSPAAITPDCPAGATDPVNLAWGIEGDVLTVGFESSAVPGATLWPRYSFRRVP